MSLTNGFYSGQNREKYSTKEYLTYGGYALLFFLIIVLYIAEIQWFDRNIHIHKLLIFSLVTGILCGIYLGYKFKHKAASLTERVQVFIFFIVISVIVMPLFVSLSNRLLSWQAYHIEEEVKLQQVEKRISERFGVLKGQEKVNHHYIVEIELFEDYFSFISEQDKYNDLKKGDKIDVEIIKGLWGFWVLKSD